VGTYFFVEMKIEGIRRKIDDLLLKEVV